MASKDLKVNVIVNAKTKQLDKMFNRLNKMQAKINQQASAQNKVTQAVRRTNTEHKKSGRLVDQLTTKVHRLANAYLGVLGAKAALGASDTITKAENKLNHLNNGDTSATQHQLDQMYTSAQKTHMGYADMMNNVSKSMTLAGGAFGGNIDNAIRFQEIMAEAYTLSGSSAAEMSSSMYQMIQGLGSGVLQGDELRSVREGASMAYQAIEEYAKGIYGAEENLKDLASEGKITSDIVVKAILSNGKTMDEAFAKTSMTFEQAWTKMKNTALKSFEPVLQKLNDLLNSPVGEAIVNGIGGAIKIVAGTIMILFNAVETVFNFVKNNWGIISKIILTGIVLIAAVMAATLFPKFIAWISFIAFAIKYYVVLAAQAIASGVSAFIAWTMAHLPLVILIAIIAAVIIAVIWMSDSFTDACGNIAGAVWVVISFIITLVKALWNYLKAVATNIGIAMSNPWEAAKAAFWGWVADVLEGIRWLEPALNAIAKLFGADGFTLSGTIDAVRAKQKASLDKLNYVDANAAFTDTWSDWSVKGAFNEGHQWGSDKAQWVTDKLGGLKDKLSGALNLGGLPNAGIAPNIDDIADIKDNTGKMADSMELTAEDLAYLKDVANMEWKKEFTTANITVDMTNNNTVSNDFDLNSLAIGLRDLVEEEMFAVANGVYA